MGEVPAQFVTFTSTVLQAVPTGEFAVICVLEMTWTFVALAAPNRTVAGLKKLVPVIVTGVFPAGAPVEGLTLLTEGSPGR